VVLADDTVLRPSQHHAARRIATPWGAAIFTAASLAHVEPAENVWRSQIHTVVEAWLRA
jgi:hypothetical protein